jgi:hypothetical protein
MGVNFSPSDGNPGSQGSPVAAQRNRVVSAPQARRLPWVGRIDVKPKSQDAEPYRFKFVGYCGDQYFFVPCRGQDTLFPDTQRPFQALVKVFPTAASQIERDFMSF